MDKEVPTHDQIVLIAQSVPDIRNRALFVMAYLTAGRINEVLPITKKDIEFTKRGDREVVVISMINEKNRKTHTKKVPFPIDKEHELLPFINDYIKFLEPNDRLFPFSDVTAWSIMKRIGFNPHFMRHTRITHWVTIYNLQDSMIVRLAGWTDARPFQRYAHLRWEDIIDKM